MPLSRRLTILGLALCFFGVALAQNVPLDALMRGGRIHYSGGRFERAREQFGQALDQYGGTADAAAVSDIHVWLGLSCAQLRDFGPAAGHFGTAIALDSAAVERIAQDEQWQYWSWTALINHARELYNSGVYDSSLHYSLSALKVNPGKSGAYSLVANSYSALEQYDEMLATAQEMLKLNTDSPEGYSLIGLYYLQKPDSLWGDDMKAARWDSCGFYYDEAIDIYEERFAGTRKALGDTLRISDPARLGEVAGALVTKSRAMNQEVLKKYIEDDLDAADKLAVVAQFAQQLFYAGNNLNVSSSRAGSAMLRAAAETGGEDGEAFRVRAESLFYKAMEYDPFDFTAMFNLGIAQYQAQNDSLSEKTFQQVIDGTVVPLAELPGDWQQKLLDVITEEMAETGYVQLDPATMASVDSILALEDRMSGGFGWFYFPALRDRDEFAAPTLDDAGDMFLSLQSPPALENVYLLLGVSRTSIGLSQEADKKGSGKEMLERAIESLKSVLKLNPENAEAWQNLVHGYRETGQQQKAVDAAEKYQKLTGGN